MVDGVCPVCGEEDYCQFIVGEQRGEPVACGAVRSIHGAALGMASHDFQDDVLPPEGDE